MRGGAEQEPVFLQRTTAMEDVGREQAGLEQEA